MAAPRPQRIRVREQHVEKRATLIAGCPAGRPRKVAVDVHAVEDGRVEDDGLRAGVEALQAVGPHVRAVGEVDRGWHRGHLQPLRVEDRLCFRQAELALHMVQQK